MNDQPNADIEAYKKEVSLKKLDKLVEARERVSTADFPTPVKELLSRYEQLYAARSPTCSVSSRCSIKGCRGI